MLTDRSIQGVRYAAHVIFLIGALLSSSPLQATTASPPAVALAWNASTDPTVTGYNVYYGTASRNYTNVLSAGSATNAVVSNLVSGVTYYFAATTYTVDGMESVYSAEASYAVPVPNNPPTLDALTNLTINQDSGEQVVALTGITSGGPNENQTLTVSAFSSNPGLIPNPTVDYTSPDTNGTVTFSPEPGSFGSAIITVMVDDGATVSNTVIRSFAVTVNPIVSPPTIDLLGDVVIPENSGSQVINLTGITSGAANGAPTLAVAATSSNPALVPTPAVSYSSPANTGTLTLSPVTNAFGSATITVTVTDSQPTNNLTTISFYVVVNQTTPVAGLLTNVVIAPNNTLRLPITPPVTNGNKFSFSLAAGAPAGVKISTTHKGVTWLIWTPTTAQASSTNLIGINITDLSNPSYSTNETAQVIVQDFVSCVLGSTSVQAGQSGSIPLALSSSEGVTNLTCAIPWPANSLGVLSVSISAAGVASSSVRTQTNAVVVNVQMASGQVLQGSNIIGSLSFQVPAAQPSGYVNIPVASLTAWKPSSVQYANVVPMPGQVAVINKVAILQPTTSGSARSLTVLAPVGNSYQLQYCTNFAAPTVWYPLTTFNQTNVSQSISLDPSLSAAFYRLQQK